MIRQSYRYLLDATGSGSSTLQIQMVRIDHTTLSKLPDAERRAFLAFGFLANEITCLQRLASLCIVPYECSHDIECEARTSQILFAVRMKIGKIREAYRTLKKFYFCRLSKGYDSELGEPARKALADFCRTLRKKEHPFNKIRDKVSFHSDDDALFANAFDSLPANSDLRIYINDRRTNWLWQYADIGIIEILSQIVGKNARDSLEYCIEESARLSDLFLLFVENWMYIAFTRHFSFNKSKLQLVELAGARPMDSFPIPFFTKEPRDLDNLMPITIRFPQPAQTSDASGRPQTEPEP